SGFFRRTAAREVLEASSGASGSKASPKGNASICQNINIVADSRALLLAQLARPYSACDNEARDTCARDNWRGATKRHKPRPSPRRRGVRCPAAAVPGVVGEMNLSWGDD